MATSLSLLLPSLSSPSLWSLAAHRLIPTRARYAAALMSYMAYQDNLLVGHAGVVVISIKGAPFSLPSIAIELLAVHGYQGLEFNP